MSSEHEPKTSPPWRDALRWALTVPLFWLLAALPLVLLSGIGRGVGLPALVYETTWPTRIALGVALGVHAAELWFVAFLLRTDRAAASPSSHAIGRFALGVLAPWGAVVLATMLLAGVRGRASWGAAVALALLAIFTALVSTRALRWAASRVQRPTAIDRWLAARLGIELHALDRLQLRLGGSVLALWLALSLLENASAVTPGALAAMVLAVVVLAAYGAVRYWAREYRMLVYLLVVAAIVAGDLATFSRTAWVPGLRASDEPGPELTVHGPAHAPALLDDEATLAQWRGDRVAPKLVVIATAGGGIRAATWTAHVLGTLERDPELAGIAHDIRVITGASGGMMGAATWVASLRPRDRALACGLDSACLHDGHAVLAEVAADSLDAVAVHFALLVRRDRGSSLEQRWIDNTGGALAKSFGALAEHEQRGALPSLVFSPLVVGDGRRVLISNLGLHALTAAIDPWPRSPAQLAATAPRSAIELFDLFRDRSRFSLATAARLSASFPYVSPAPRLPLANATVRLADAGLYDPFGVELATRWISGNAQWLAQHTGGVVLIEIRDDAGARSELALDDPPLLLRAGDPLLGPLAAVLAARQGSAAHRNDVAVDVLGHRFAALLGRSDFFTRVVLARSGQASLSWHLSPAEQDAIVASLPAGGRCGDDELAELDAAADDVDDVAAQRPTCTPNVAELERLRRWWRH